MIVEGEEFSLGQSSSRHEEILKALAQSDVTLKMWGL